MIKNDNTHTPHSAPQCWEETTLSSSILHFAPPVPSLLKRVNCPIFAQLFYKLSQNYVEPTNRAVLFIKKKKTKRNKKIQLKLFADTTVLCPIRFGENVTIIYTIYSVNTDIRYQCLYKLTQTHTHTYYIQRYIRRIYWGYNSSSRSCRQF